MPRLSVTLFLLFYLIIFPSSFAQFWVPANAIPDSAFILDQYDREENGTVYANLNGKRMVIMLGGRSGAGKVDSKRPVIYDMDTNRLTMGENANDQYHHFQAALWRDSIIVVGMSFDNGYPNEVPQEELYLYYIQSDTWVLQSTVPVARRRGSSQCVVYNDTVYFFNGLTDGHKGGWVNWTDKYDLVNNVWDTLSPSPHARDHAAALLDGTDVYLVGGRRSATGAGGLNAFPELTIDKYDILTDTWTTLPDSLPSIRAGLQAVLHLNSFGHKQISIWGGEIDGDALLTGIGYDMAVNAWNTLPDLVEKTHGTSAVVVSDDTLSILSGRDIANNHLVADPYYVQLYYGAPILLPLSWEETRVMRSPEGQIHLGWSVDVPEDGVFEVQMKWSNGQWATIGQVPTGNGSGNAYEWTFSNSSFSTEGVFRIHLKMKDGTESWSPNMVSRVRYKLSDVPRPITDQNRTIRFLYGEVSRAELFSLTGQFVMAVDQPYQMQLPQELPAGKYLLRVMSRSGDMQTETLVVE